jgi:glycosyltransferase involved in cell wall biosynthesis
LESVAKQKLRNIEIICVNDGSTDNSSKIIKQFAANNQRVKVIEKKNSGYGDSMNQGLDAATGEYIAIVESDDFIDNNMLAELYKLAKKNRADVVKSEFYYYWSTLDKDSPQWNDEFQAVYSPELDKIIRQQNLKSEVINQAETGRVINPRVNQSIFFQKPCIWSAIYRRQFLNENGIRFLPSPGASYQDTGFAFKVWSKAKRVVFTKQAYLHYRQDNEKSSVNSPGKVFCVQDEYKEIEKFLKKHNLFYDLDELMFLCRLGAYRWNFERLTDGLDAEFINQIAQEFKRDDKRKMINWDSWNDNLKREIRAMMLNPDMCLKRKQAAKRAKISIIVPFYNVERYLDRCLKSLVNQTLDEIEIICIDDGSTDNSIKIAEKYWEKDPRVSLISQSNQGLSSARNTGLWQTHAPLIQFCDGDDWFEPDMCLKMHTAMTKQKVDLACCGINMVYDDELDDNVKKEFGDEKYYQLKFSGKVAINQELIRLTDVSVCNKIFRRSLIRQNDFCFPHGLRYEDFYFTTIYLLLAKTAFFLSKTKLYNYRRRNQSIMAQTFQQSPDAVDHIKVMFMLIDFTIEHQLFEEYQELLIKQFYDFTKLSFQYSPDSCHPEILTLIRDFVKQHDKYFNKVDSAIARQILKELSKIPISLQSRIKHKVKQPLGKLLLYISPTYRKQQQIVNMLSDLHYKIDRISSADD